MNATEFPIDLNIDNEGLGELFITDIRALVKPGTSNYYKRARHNVGHAHGILAFGENMGLYKTHIVSHLDPDQTHRLLDQVFHAFVDGCCLELWCDAVVSYIVDAETVKTEEYGFADGNYTMFFNVYCNVPEGSSDDLLATVTGDLDPTDRFVVIRPDESELGYTVQGFTVDQPPEDRHERYDDSIYYEPDLVGMHKPRK